MASLTEEQIQQQLQALQKLFNLSPERLAQVEAQLRAL